MNLEQQADLIRQVPLFSHIEPAVRKLLCFAAEHLRLEAGQTLFRAGEAADAAYVVLRGTLDITLPTAAGELRMGSVGIHDLVGEIGVFLEDANRTATITAATQAEVLCISRELLQNVVRSNPEAAMRITQLLARRLADTTARLGAPAG